jgi:hypothetical protein
MHLKGFGQVARVERLRQGTLDQPSQVGGRLETVIAATVGLIA